MSLSLDQAKDHVQNVTAAVHGSSSSMVSVPEIENDPHPERKLAVMLFHVTDALRIALTEIEELKNRPHR